MVDNKKAVKQRLKLMCYIIHVKAIPFVIDSNLKSIKSPGYLDANNVDYDTLRPKDIGVNTFMLLSQNKFKSRRPSRIVKRI